MNQKLKDILENPDVQQMAGSAIAVAAGFAADKLIGYALRRTPFGLVGLVVLAGAAAWISRHPEKVDEWTQRFIRSRSTPTQ